MNEYKAIYESRVGRYFTIRDSWRMEAGTKKQVEERVLSVHPAAKVISIRKMPAKLGLVT